MKKIRTTILRVVSIGLLAAASALAQNGGFSDPNVEYRFEIPDAKWKMTVKPSATVPNVEYVYVDRTDGHLEVRNVASSGDTPMDEIIKAEEQKLQFLPGYVAGKEENFGGFLKGAVFNFEFVRAGRPMSGRFYFLRAGDQIYLLRFTGFRDKLRSIRNQTDSIARTFEIKKSA